MTIMDPAEPVPQWDARPKSPNGHTALASSARLAWICLLLAPTCVAAQESIGPDERYREVTSSLETLICHEVEAQGLSVVSIALVADGKIVWSKGFGMADPANKRPATAEANHNFVADPMKGSKHNRGCAVDLTLYDLKTGKPVEMFGGYDEFSDRSNPFYPGGTSRQRWYRDTLRQAMEVEGFSVNEFEWWHFDSKDWLKYQIGNE